MADPTKRHFPVFLDLDRRLALVIGEGPALEKRVRQLLRYQADVVVVTPTPSEALLESEAAGLITVEQRAYVSGDLAGAFIVLCVTDDVEVQRAVFDEAESGGCLVNVSGAPQYCNFILPSVINRDPLQVAISTGGIAPELARQLRRELEGDIGTLWPKWMTLVVEARALAAQRLNDPEQERLVYEVATGEWTRDRLSLGMEVTAEEVLAEALSRGVADEPDPGGEEPAQEGA